MVSELTERRAATPTVTERARRREWPSAQSLSWAIVPAAVSLGSLFFMLSHWMAFARYETFNGGRFDLEIYTQVVWNTSQGRPFETTLLKTNLNHLAEHVALVQDLALALLGWPVFQWARRALGSRGQALLVLACFYAGPALASIALDDFHALPLATVPLGIGLWLVLAGRPRLVASVALIALPIEEESGLLLVGLAALLVVRRRPGLGLLVGGLAALWLAVAVFVVMPRFHDPRTLGLVGGNRTVSHFSDIRQDPSALLGRLLGQRGMDAAVWLALPTAGLGLLAPQTLLVGAPSFAALLLQNRDDTFGRHWAAPLMMALWLSGIAGLARLRVGRPRSIGLGLLVLGTALAFWLVSPLPGGGSFNPAALSRDERTDLLTRATG